jgi:hypothetical protein
MCQCAFVAINGACTLYVGKNFEGKIWNEKRRINLEKESRKMRGNLKVKYKEKRLKQESE